MISDRQEFVPGWEVNRCSWLGSPFIRVLARLMNLPKVACLKLAGHYGFHASARLRASLSACAPWLGSASLLTALPTELLLFGGSLSGCA